MVKELGERLSANLCVVRCVGQFLQVFYPAQRFRRSFSFERLDVAGAIDKEADQFRKGGRIAGFSEMGLLLPG